MTGNFPSALNERKRRRFPITSHWISSQWVEKCQSKRLNFLGISRWRTAVLLSTLRITTAKANLSTRFPDFFYFNRSSGCGRHIYCGTHGSQRKFSFSVMLTGECRAWTLLFISLAELDSSSGILFNNSALPNDCCLTNWILYSVQRTCAKPLWFIHSNAEENYYYRILIVY